MLKSLMICLSIHDRPKQIKDNNGGDILVKNLTFFSLRTTLIKSLVFIN